MSETTPTQHGTAVGIQSGMKRALLSFALVSASMFYANAQPHETTIAALRDQHRALLVFGNGNNTLAEKQLTIAASHADGFRQRDLLLVGLEGSNDKVPTAMLSAVDDAAARKRFHITPGQFTVVLLGKDGGEKFRSHQPVSWQKLSHTIDAMPTRQDEMRQGGKS